MITVLVACVSVGLAAAAPLDGAPVVKRRVRHRLQRSAFAESGPSIAGCPILPANDVWNARVDMLPVDAHAADYVASSVAH